MSEKLTSGEWFDVANAREHANLQRFGKTRPESIDRMSGYQVQIGEYSGPGRYLLLSYMQRCPRNCCDDNVSRVLSAADVAEAARDEMRELAELLRQAKGNK